MPKQKRCLLVECLSYHEECFPGWIFLLAQLGYQVDIYVSRAQIDRNATIATPPGSFRYHNLAELPRARLEDYDFVFLASLLPAAFLLPAEIDPRPGLELLRGLGLPSISVIHEVRAWLANEDLAAHLAAPAHAALVLCQHAHLHIGERTPGIDWVLPNHFGAFAGRRARRGWTIPGEIDFNRKNFGSLLDAAPRLRTLPDGTIIVAGGSRESGDSECMRRVEELRKQLTARGAGSRVHFTGHLSYDDYFRCLRDSRFIIPLIDEAIDAEAYLTKAASGVMLSLAFGVPMILNQTMARLYGLEFMITYRGVDLGAGLEQARRLDADGYQRMERLTRAKSDEISAHNLATLGNVITGILA